MGSRAFTRGPFLALPIHKPLRWCAVNPLPPGLTGRRYCRVRKDRVVMYGLNHVGIRFFIRAGSDTEETGIRIDRAQSPMGANMHPGDVVAYGPDAVALVFQRGNHHCEVRLAARPRKRSCHVTYFAGGILQAKDQHVLGHPALLARHPARNSQRKTFLAEKRITAIAGANAPDQFFFRKMKNKAPLGVKVTEGVKSRDEIG